MQTIKRRATEKKSREKELEYLVDSLDEKYQETQEGDHLNSLLYLLPFILNIPLIQFYSWFQPTLIILLGYHVNWMEVTGFTHAQVNSSRSFDNFPLDLK